MHPKDKGEKVEAAVLSSLVMRDIAVLTPFGENHRYDFVIEIDGSFYRLQCKTGRDEGDKIIFSTRSTGPSRTDLSTSDYDDDIDFFAVRTLTNDRVYLVSVDEASSNEMTLRTAPPGNNQSKGINWADEYTLERRLPQLSGA
ncbi:hypothetical protein C474_10871 [Halogeometricum pallidum JCM 14848]|uniref:PD(D/E)XK endonuclease domain-containing protein n=1 Tax=Halogeometricum pallidum JCM 14848 TaxID=1227487 RepID=M0D9X7_HALPD|nr:hypothetical protein C474_10871 [Halogeometricum pallidum JCM 14848]